MDYSDFLQTGDETVRLPYINGGTVCDAERTYRLKGASPPPGWYSFRLTGRNVDVVEAIDPEFDCFKRRSLQGYLSRRDFVDNERMQVLHHVPVDNPPERYAPISAVEWFDGQLLFTGVGFETEIELAVREAWEEDREITMIKGVTPALAQVFLVDATERVLRRLAEEEALAQAERVRVEADERARFAEFERRQNSLEGRIARALSHTGATLLDWHRQNRNQARVRYRFGASRYECVVDVDSLQIIDAGICLDGTDRQLNLSSLPAAVREAVETGQLHVTRR